MKFSAKFIAFNAFLVIFILGTFFLYISAKEPKTITLLLGLFALALMSVYNVVYFHSNRSTGSKVKTSQNSDIIRPLNYIDMKGDVPPIQVAPEIRDSIKIGKNYYSGMGLPRDFTRAFSLLFEGALAGDAEAQMFVGKMFLYGQGIPHNLVNGKIWLEAASFQGNAEAQYLLGNIYAEQEDTISILKAMFFLGKSSDQGNEKARLRLKELTRSNSVAQKADLKSVSSDCYYDYENNPFIRSLCLATSKDSGTSFLKKDLSKAYKVLNVAPGSSFTEIRQAYLNLMLKFHPDRNKMDSKKVLLVREAYDIISSRLRN